MRKSQVTKRVLSVIIAAAIVIGLVPLSSFVASAASSKLNIGVMSDVHYYPQEYMANTAAFEEFAKSGNKQYINQEGILDSAFAAFKKAAEDKGLKYVIIPGDLTRNGEYEGHKAFAKRLEKFEKETGIEVFVINGNHDINNYKAASFENGESAVSVRSTLPEEFKEIYANLGYDHAVSEYVPKDGEVAGQLSYAAELDGYRLIFIDGGKYSFDNTSDGQDGHETGGNYTEGVMNWVLGELETAKKKGQTPIAVDHWSLVPHYESQATILQGFVLDNYLEVSETLADAGLHYIFTGHSHSNDVAKHINDNGEVLYDIQTNSLVEYPHFIRYASFNTDPKGKVTLDYETVDCDSVLPVTSNGVTYKQPYRESFSFNYMFGDGANGYVRTLLGPMIKNLFADIQEQGGLVNYINGFFDIEDFLYSNSLGAVSANIMSFVNDLGAQIDKKYIEDPEYTLNTLYAIIDELCDMQVSDYPCLTLYDEYGYGDPDKPGTFGDVVIVAFTQMGAGNEDISDPFMQDVIDRFENGDLGKQVFDKLYELLVDKLLQDEILSGLYVNADKLFAGYFPVAGGYTQLALDIIVAAFGDDFKGNITKIIKDALESEGITDRKSDTTYLQLVNAALKMLDKLGVLKGGSIDGVLGNIMEEYLTQSQYEAWGHTFAYVIQDFASDSNPTFKGDHSGRVNDDKCAVEASVDNYRLPALISVSLGNDSETTRNISWYSKYTLDSTDIEIVELKSENSMPRFSGKSGCPSYLTVTKETAEKDRTFPGVDLGIIGILPFTLHLNRHIVKIEGLKKDSVYAFRVGNESYGWWSESGIIKTADGSDEVTFLHLTDSQGQNEKQYSIVNRVLSAAKGLYPDADLIIHSGDMVDEGSNVNYWKYFFNCSSELLSTPLMPVAGNHEAKGEFALDDNFVLPDSASQNTESGYYYSFDYNNVHFIMLNTNDSDKNGLGEEQLNWLKADAQASQADWKVVVLHKAIYSNGSHFDDSEVVAMRSQFATLMPELGIDIVFQGHDHVYLRTGAMNNNAVVDVDMAKVSAYGAEYDAYNNPGGTIYAIDGASGCKNYISKSNSETDKLFPRAEKIVDADAPVFAGIRVSGSTLYFDAYMLKDGTPEKIDSFAIQKSQLKGDADCNGKIEVADARVILQMALEIEPASAADLKICDVDGDGKITAADARIVLCMALGIDY